MEDSAPNGVSPLTPPKPPEPSFKYWAKLPPDELGERLTTKVRDLRNETLPGVINGRVAKAFLYYFGTSPDGIHATSAVLRGGEQGELAQMRVNHSRSLVNSQLNLVSAPKLVWQAKAVNIDYDSILETELAAAILEYYWGEYQISKFAVRALEEAIVFSEGFSLIDWDDALGDEVLVDPETGEQVKTGDISITNISSWDVIRDPSADSWESLDWVVVRLLKNKYVLAAKYPEHAEEIVEQGLSDELMGSPLSSQIDKDESDRCYVYLFLHKANAAIPPGRKTLFLSNGTVLSDDVCPDFPLFRVSAGETFSTPYGYTNYFDILGPQELMDSLETAIATNQTTFGVQNILAPLGSELSPDELYGGVRVIYYPPDSKPPEALQLTRTPPEIFENLERLKKNEELLMGLNSVVRGEPQSGEQSGSALVLLQSQALQQASALQASYLRFVEGLGGAVLRLIQKNLSAEKKIAIVGKQSAFLVNDTTYTGKSLGRIKKVSVEIGNPLSQTAAGRIELATQLINMGFIKSPEQFQQVLTTGRLEPLTQSLNNELLLIRSENESLAKGEVVPAIAVDDHRLHAREHRAVLANPQARKNPQAVQAILSHIDEHEQLLMSSPPSTLMLMGQEPLMMPMPPGEPGAPAAPPAAPRGPQGASDMPAPPEMPEMPEPPPGAIPPPSSIPPAI